MGYANLSIALSPTMLRPKEETIETLISHGDTLANLIAVIIEHYKLFFEVNKINLYNIIIIYLFFKLRVDLHQDYQNQHQIVLKKYKINQLQIWMQDYLQILWQTMDLVHLQL